MQYKGLKNLISGFGYLFHLDTDHPYNPTVSLSESYIEKMLTLRALAETELSQYYYFESPVSSYSAQNEDSALTEHGDTLQQQHQARSRTESTESISEDVSAPDPRLQEEAIEWAHGIGELILLLIEAFHSYSFDSQLPFWRTGGRCQWARSANAFSNTVEREMSCPSKSRQSLRG
jgi:hypothetical protein